jgi:hypothetical protein
MTEVACPNRLDVLPRFASRCPTAELVAVIFSCLMRVVGKEQIYVLMVEQTYV